jgi:hypothetical protein
MSLEQFIREKAWRKYQKKLHSVRSNFELMLPKTAWKEHIHPEDFRNHADAHGSNILTDMFGVEFNTPDFANEKRVAQAFVQILILAYDINVESSLFNPEVFQKSDLNRIKKKIMEQMESAIPDDEPETSITIKGKGITIDGQ